MRSKAVSSAPENQDIIDARRLHLPGTPDSLTPIREMVSASAHCGGFDESTIAQIEMAVDEACSNIIEHAYLTQPMRLEIEVRVEAFSNRLEVTIIDYSTIDFPVDEMPGVPVEDYLDAQRRRGLGLYIIRSFVDQVEHRFIGGQGNELRLVKYRA